MRKTTILALAFLLLGGTLWGNRPVEADTSLVCCQTEEQQRRYDYYYLEAIRLKLKQQYDAAYEMVQHCLSIDPEAPSALYEAAQFYLMLKMTGKSQAALETAVRNAPDNYWYSQGLANLYLQTGQEEKAAALLEDMSTRFPAKLETLYVLLQLYNKEDNIEKQLSTLNRIEQRTGKSEQVSMEKFRIYLRNGDSKKAFAEMESLVKEYPQDMRYRVLLGNLYMQNGKEKQAYNIYQDVLAEEPDNVMALYSLLAYYEETGQEDLYNSQMDQLLFNRKVSPDAKLDVMREFIVKNEQEGGDTTRVISLFDRIMEQEPDDPQLPMLYAQYLYSKGLGQQALPVLAKVLDIEPTNTAARLMLLDNAVRREDYAQVTSLCEGGVESNPDRLEFYLYLAIAYNHDDRTDDVLDVCRRAVSHVDEKSDKALVSDLYSILGDVYYTKRMTAEAYAAYDSALVYKPDNIGALNNYAYYISVEGGDLDKAEEMSYRTVKASPDNATYLDTYAWILFVKGNYSEAQLYIDNALKTEEGMQSAVIVEHGGDIYYKVGDEARAVELWQRALQLGGGSAVLQQKIKERKYIPYKPEN